MVKISFLGEGYGQPSRNDPGNLNESNNLRWWAKQQKYASLPLLSFYRQSPLFKANNCNMEPGTFQVTTLSTY